MKKLFKVALAQPIVVMVLAVAITILAATTMMADFRMETNLDKYMPETHPAFVFSDEADERFMIRDAILIALEHPDSIYNPDSLAKIIQIGEDLAKIEELSESRIQSVYTGDNILGTEDGLDVRRFYTEAPANQIEADRIGALVRANDMIAGRLVSADERTALVIVELPDSGFSRSLYDKVLALAEGYEGPETVHVAGRPIVEGTLGVLGPQDMKRTGPLVILVIAAVLILVLKQVRRAIITLVVVLFSTIWTFGLMTAFGIPLYSISIMIPVMLVAIGVAYAIHLYNQIDHYTGEKQIGRAHV